MMERCAPLESSRKRRRKERKEKKRDDEKIALWTTSCVSAPELYRGSFDRTAIGATVLLLMMESDGTYPSVSLSLICRIDICVLILSLVLFSPLVHIFFLLLCAMGELGNHQRWLNQLYRGEVSQRVYPVSCEKNASSDAVSSLATLDIPLFFFHYLH